METTKERVGQSIEHEIEQIVRAQKEEAPHFAQTSASERIEMLQALRETLLEHRQQIRDALWADFRKPPAEVDLTEIASVAAEISHACQELPRWMDIQYVSTPWTHLGTQSHVRYEAKGVVLIVAPWNYPLNLTLGPLVSALAAGNCVVLKPSEYTPRTGALIAKLIDGLFSERRVAVIEGGKEVAQTLTRQPFDHIFFTGGTAVGRHVMRAAAENLTPVTLELGGKSPVVVGARANVRDAAAKIAWGKFSNAGQTCIAPDYVLAHEQVYEELVDAIGEEVRRFYGESAEERRESPDYARLIHRDHFDRVHSLFERSVMQGARIAFGGSSDEQDLYLEPTLLTNVPAQAPVMEEEIFGPILPLLSFADEEEVFGQIEAHPDPLVIYIFDRRRSFIDRVVERTHSGTVAINETLWHFQQPELPFGGVGKSGLGKAHGWYGFRTFSNERAVLERTFGSRVAQTLYPPYDGLTERISEWLSGLR